jgi:hypothetical protein
METSTPKSANGSAVRFAASLTIAAVYVPLLATMRAFSIDEIRAERERHYGKPSADA